MPQTTTQVLLKTRPVGEATADCFSLETNALPPLEDNQIRVAVEYISVDAGTRTMLRGEGFHHQVGVGEVIRAGGVGREISATAPGFSRGQAVRGALGAQTIATVTPDDISKVDDIDSPLSAHLGVLGDSTGVNVFFDNVGGDVLDAVLDNLAMRARVIIYGAISQYDDMDNVTGPSMYLRLAERQSSMEGFAYFHFPESIEPARAELAKWLADGSLIATEEILQGIERYPDALQFMFQGGNLGKLLVKAGK